MIKNSILLAPLCLLFLTACPEPSGDDNDSENNSELPDSFEKLSISMYDGGGMLPVSFKTEINNDSAYWQYRRYGNETIINWTPTEKELNDLYSELKANDMNLIKADCGGEVFDRGGLSIKFVIDGTSYDVDNSGNCFIQEKWKEKYHNIVTALTKYRTDKVNEQMLSKPIEVTDAFLNCGYDPEIQVVSSEHIFIPSKDTVTRSSELYPGINEFIVRLNYKDSTDYYGSPANFAYEQFFDTVYTDSKKILIDWKDEKVLLTVEN